ncbi:unnamed protein product [Spirodela intermedia]|uniref:Uncharacterized protein n=1 Tax=Spirodela intermedia TaxID=51605 RepID=A0A7I8IR45_SPIIN|nr:unnamed protein product [Spirodela intermedia]CAA6659411.1 unnamed protein product [Spirodela intermedia]
MCLETGIALICSMLYVLNHSLTILLILVFVFFLNDVFLIDLCCFLTYFYHCLESS